MNQQHRCYYENCENSYSSKYNLVRHINTTHLNIKKHSCQLCYKCFTNKQGLFIHLKTHENVFQPCPASKATGRSEFLLSDHYQEQKEILRPIPVHAQPPALPEVGSQRERMQRDLKLPVVLVLIPDLRTN